MTGWLFDTVLYTGLLIGFVLLVRRPAGRYFGPQFAYMLWALPFARLLLPPVVLPASLAPAPAPAEMAATPAAAAWVEAAPSALTATPVAPPVAAAAPAIDWALVAQIGLSAWLGIALAFLAWRIVTYRRMRRVLLAEARPVGDVGRIRLVETPEVTAPVAFGVFDKVVALPPLFMAQPDRAARDLAIAHELAHHRGHDLLANFAAQALLALHWFNPLAWMGWRAMRRDQEAACDARVLAGRGRDERARYAALIAGAAAGQRLALAAPMACPVLGDKSIIHRLRSLSMSDTTPGRRWLGRGLIAAGAFALPLTASVSFAADEQEVPAPPAPPAPPFPVAAPSAIEAPLAPDAPEAALPPEAAEPGVQRFVLRRGGPGEAGTQVRQFVLRGDGEHPFPAPPHIEWRALGNPDDPAFQAQMEQW
ncbi:MAG TPA: M56 family metallopeptidase, partial [Croceibacterium sp.]|nr:M56 family metallopeptidase [Croceibacterium sp.]